MDNKRTLQTIFIYALFALFFVLLIRMFYPFFTVILWTSLLYIILYPLYQKCHNKLNPEKKGYQIKRSLLAGSFSLGTMLIIVAFFGLIFTMLSKQLISFLLIVIVMMQNSKDDINDAFNGSKSELFKNEKTRGFELLLQRSTVVLAILFIASVVLSVALH